MWLTNPDKEIVVTYTYAQCDLISQRDNRSFEPPKICYGGDDLENCRTLKPEEYVYNKDNCSIEVRLVPGESVKVDTLCCSYTGEGEQSRRTHLGELTIKTPKGLIKYTEAEILKAFKEKDKTKYILSYL